jgi:hypothetical protein
VGPCHLDQPRCREQIPARLRKKFVLKEQNNDDLHNKRPQRKCKLSCAIV